MYTYIYIYIYSLAAPQLATHNTAFRTQVHDAGSQRIVANCKTPQTHSKRGFATQNAETGL